MNGPSLRPCNGEPPMKKAHTDSGNQPQKYDPTTVLEARKRSLADGIYTFYDKPIMIVRGQMQYLFDESNRRYLDAYNNVQSVGHCPPHVTKRIAECLSTMGTLNTRYLNPMVGEYCDKLRSVLPPELNTFVFVNSGSEANDLAIRLSRTHTQRNGVVGLQNAYHGVTGTCTGISTCLAPGTPIPGSTNRTCHTNESNEGCFDHDYYAKDVRVAEVPDNVRGAYKFSDPDCAEKYAGDIEAILKADNGLDCVGKPWAPAAFIHESIQGCGGQVVFPKGYIERVYSLVRAAGGLCIADEVQVGFGRTGRMWGFEEQGVVPDIVTMGKPAGNGHPLGIVVMRKEIAESFGKCQFFSTFGGNPTSCAAGLAVLEAVEQDNLLQNVQEQSALLFHLLREVKARNPCISEVRGSGLFVGIEVCKEGSTDPDANRTVQIMETAKNLGLIVGKGGPHGNVIRMKGPLCVNEEDIRFISSTIERSIREPDARM